MPAYASNAATSRLAITLHSVRDGELELALGRRRWRIDPDLTLAVAAAEAGPGPGGVELRALRTPANGADWLRVTLSADACRRAAARAGLPAGVLLGGHLLPHDAAWRAAWDAARGRPPAAGSGADAPVADTPDATPEAMLARLVAQQHAAWRAGSRTFACRRESTRESLLERILVASDHMAGRYDEPLDLDAMAEWAHLSRFHFVRSFRAVHGITPHAWLVRRRAMVARRRLQAGDGVAEAALRAGFGSRSALFRHLRATPDAPTSPCCPSA